MSKIGEKIGKLTVLRKDLMKSFETKSTWYVCLCDCKVNERIKLRSLSMR